MEYGFSYNGIHCNDMGCTYIPSATKRQVLPDYSVVSSDIAGRDGGYFYSANLKIRTFSLDCYFEDITDSQLRKISRWVDRNTAGTLIFDARPEVRYTVRPTKAFEPELYEHVLDGNSYSTYSGTFSMTFSAYDPFGYLTKTVYGVGEDASSMQTYCGVLREDQMPPSPSVESSSFLVYNCGTEPCGMHLSLRGAAPNGIVINNLTNGSSCKLLALPEEPAILAIDGDNCRVRYGFGDTLDNPYANTFEDFFEFHDDGYVLLDSYEEVYRDLSVSWTSGTNAVVIDSGLVATDSLIGKYIWIESTWRRIEDVLNDGSQMLAGSFAEDGHQTSMITTMNEITISGEGMVLTDIYVSCSPKVQ